MSTILTHQVFLRLSQDAEVQWTSGSSMESTAFKDEALHSLGPKIQMSLGPSTPLLAPPPI
jgi:hypothetical protein